jgi:hypothetical protein
MDVSIMLNHLPNAYPSVHFVTQLQWRPGGWKAGLKQDVRQCSSTFCWYSLPVLECDLCKQE